MPNLGFRNPINMFDHISWALSFHSAVFLHDNESFNPLETIRNSKWEDGLQLNSQYKIIKIVDFCFCSAFAL